MTIQLKAVEQYFPLVPFVMLYKVVLTFEWVCGWNPKVWLFKWKLLCSTCSFYVVLFAMFYKVVLTFGSVLRIGLQLTQVCFCCCFSLRGPTVWFRLKSVTGEWTHGFDYFDTTDELLLFSRLLLFKLLKLIPCTNLEIIPRFRTKRQRWKQLATIRTYYVTCSGSSLKGAVS